MDYTSGTSGTKDLAKNGITAVTANEVYTFSFWCKSSNQFTMTVFFYNNNTGVQVASAKLDGATATTATDGRVSVVVTTTWTKHTITWTFNTNTTSLAKNLLFRIAYGNDLFVSQVKLQKGTISTPWIPNSADSEYVGSSLSFVESGTTPTGLQKQTTCRQENSQSCESDHLRKEVAA